MSKIKIITDAASDISSEDELKYGIRVIPFQVTLGDESYTTRVDMDNAQFYARMAQCDEIPKTAQVNPFQSQEIYLQEAQAGYTDLILVLINSEGSATYGNSLLAAEQFFEEHPEYRAEAKQDLQLLNAQKMGEHEAEIEKIKNVFLAILRDIKKDIDNGEQPGEAVTAAMFQAMRDALEEQKKNPLSIDDVTAMIAGQIGQLAPMDEETVEQFRQLAKKMMVQAGGTQNEEKP